MEEVFFDNEEDGSLYCSCVKSKMLYGSKTCV